MDFAIVADDLTGAADCAGQFARRGHAAVVSFDLAAPADGPGALAIDTESRHLPATQAAARVAAAVGAVRDTPVLVKKIDSTLRGPIAAELDAALAVSGRRSAIVAPAYPTYGRTTQDGVQRVDGVPVALTAVAGDPLAPVTESHLPTLLAPHDPGCVSRVARDMLADPTAVLRVVRSARITVIDIATESDLDRLVALIPDHRELLWCGSTGLVAALGRAHPGPEPAATDAAGPAGRVIVAVGSLNATTRTQLEALRARPDVRVLDVDGPRTAEPPAVPEAACVVLCSSAVRSRSPARVAAALAAAAVWLLDTEGFGGLVVTGGDTARAVLERAGVTGIRMRGEVELGVPIGEAIGGRPLWVVSKAGGFGSPLALCRAVDRLYGVSSVESTASPRSSCPGSMAP